MKILKNIFGVLSLFTFALTFTACSDEDTFDKMTLQQSNEYVTMKFTAGISQTRTELQPKDENGNYAVYWKENDVIGIYSIMSENMDMSGGLKSSPFTTDLVGTASTATFTGIAMEDAIQYVAVYPQEKFTDCICGDGVLGLSFLLPTIQHAVVNGFETDLNPSWALTTEANSNLYFRNLCSLVKFSISANDVDDLEYITLTDLGENNSLSGEFFYIDASEQGIKVMMSSGDPISSVILEGPFTTGVDYYFVIAPISSEIGSSVLMNGFSLTFTKNDGTSFVKTSVEGLDKALTAGEILNLGNIQLGEFKEDAKITNTAFIAAVEEAEPSIGWTKDEGTGYVTLTPKNKIAIEAIRSLDISNKGLTDISGIENFTNLQSLQCHNNVLTSLDVSQLSILGTLDCSNNKLTSLDVSNLSFLGTLDCSNNNLTLLTMGELTGLKELDCYENNISSLDIGGLSGLSTLRCYSNCLSELNIINNNGLYEIVCGNQTDGSTPKTLMLYLNADQEIEWNESWKAADLNNNVEIKLGIGYGGSSDDLDEPV